MSFISYPKNSPLWIALNQLVFTAVIANILFWVILFAQMSVSKPSFSALSLQPSVQDIVVTQLIFIITVAVGALVSAWYIVRHFEVHKEWAARIVIYGLSVPILVMLLKPALCTLGVLSPIGCFLELRLTDPTLYTNMASFALPWLTFGAITYFFFRKYASE